MKPASIISLIVAVVLVAAGFITCTVAKNMAASAGQSLFAENRDDGIVHTVDLTDVPLSKLEIHVMDADIYIHGKSEKAYMELVNFRENYYNLATTNRVLSFDEVPDMFSLLKFWENGFSFKGMRYLLDFRNEPEGAKAIHVYLTEQQEVKVYHIQGDACRISLEDLTTSADYQLKMQSGTLSAKNIRTNSTFQLTGGEISVDMESCFLRYFTAEADNLGGVMRRITSTEASFTLQNANQLHLIPTQVISLLSIDAAMGNGTITVNGNALGNAFVQSPSLGPFSGGTLQIRAESGSIVLEDPAKSSTTETETSGSDANSDDTASNT